MCFDNQCFCNYGSISRRLDKLGKFKFEFKSNKRIYLRYDTIIEKLIKRFLINFYLPMELCYLVC